jgi:hypothetical protein
MSGVLRQALLSLKVRPRPVAWLIVQLYRFGSAVHKALTCETILQIASSNRLDLTEDGEFAQKAMSLGAEFAIAPVM